MAFSGFLDSKRGACRALVAELRRSFAYVSILGTDVRATMFHTNRRSSAICDGEGECGFVVRPIHPWQKQSLYYCLLQIQYFPKAK